MLVVDHKTPAHGLDRAADMFRLQRLSSFADASAVAEAVFENFGFDQEKRSRLAVGLAAMLPIKGDPMAEGLMTSSMFAGVLIGLLIADAALPAESGLVPHAPPLDL